MYRIFRITAVHSGSETTNLAVDDWGVSHEVGDLDPLKYVGVLTLIWGILSTKIRMH